MKAKRLLSLVLVVAMTVCCFAFADFSAVAAQTDTTDVSAQSQYELGYSKHDGLILQAWNWSYTAVEQNLDAIAEAGFTTIQISPPNELKEGTKGVKVLTRDDSNGWWMMYQPAAYELNQSTDNVLGTKDQMISMINAAHDKGLFVVADAVINHLGNAETATYKIDPNTLPKDAKAVDYLCKRAWDFDSSKAIIDADAFHYPYANCVYNDTGAFDCTQNCVSLLPDLDTSKEVVQSTILRFWQDCVDAGLDGFRIDAAKHIETKYDGKYASTFWDNLMFNGVGDQQGIVPYAESKYDKELYFYGEILNTVSTERSFSWYLDYMNITNSTAFYAICDAVNNGVAKNAVPESFNNGMTNKTAILWDESHDTYMDGCKGKIALPSTALLLKRWACMASRADVVSMYLARPTDTASQVYNLDLGVVYDTAWNDAGTVAVNKFHNHFQGAPEAVSSSGNIAVIERGDSGVVLVNCKGTAVSAANIPMSNLKDGTYVDQITKQTFTCTGGKLSGSIGTSGVAVIYNPADPVLYANRDSGKFTSETIDVDLYANGAAATYQINDGEPVSFSGKTTVTLGKDLTNGTTDPTNPSSVVGGEIGILGDADENDTVNVRDATLIQKASAFIVELSDKAKLLADVNGDDGINVKDATAIQKYSANIETNFPIGEMLTDGSNNPPAPVGADGTANSTVTLTLKVNDVTKEYTYMKVSQEDTTWVKYDNSTSQWTHVYCYAYTDDSTNNTWPGLLMTETENDIWYYELPEEYYGATVIFSNNLLGNGSQSSDLPLADESGSTYSKHFIYTNDTWNAIGTDGSYTEIQPVEGTNGNYIVWTDANNWGLVYYYCWGGGPAMNWPGTKMDYIGTNDMGQKQYGAYIDKAYTSLIFNNKNGGKQTVDITVSGNCGYYPSSTANKCTVGTFDVTPPTK